MTQWLYVTENNEKGRVENLWENLMALVSDDEQETLYYVKYYRLWKLFFLKKFYFLVLHHHLSFVCLICDDNELT